MSSTRSTPSSTRWSSLLDRGVEGARRRERADVQLVDHRARELDRPGQPPSVQATVAGRHSCERLVHAVGLARATRVGQRASVVVEDEAVVGRRGRRRRRRATSRRPTRVIGVSRAVERRGAPARAAAPRREGFVVSSARLQERDRAGRRTGPAIDDPAVDRRPSAVGPGRRRAAASRCRPNRLAEPTATGCRVRDQHVVAAQRRPATCSRRPGRAAPGV